MNSIELTEQQKQEVLDEASRAFEFNIEVSNDILHLSETNTFKKQGCISFIRSHGKDIYVIKYLYFK